MLTQFAPIRSRKAFEEVVEQIAQAIRAGSLRVGDRLPSERLLAAQMQISRPTLREAIRVLSGAGVLAARRGPGGGTFVDSEVIPVELLHAQSDLLIGEVAGVLEARRVLEPRVAQLAAIHATDEDFAALRRVIERQRLYTSEDQRTEFLQLDLRFHLTIAQATHNGTILAFMKTLLTQLEIAWDMAIRGPHEPEQMIEIHEQTLRALMSRDPAAIEEVMDQHMSWLEKFWQEETGQTPLHLTLQSDRKRASGT